MAGKDRIVTPPRRLSPLQPAQGAVYAQGEGRALLGDLGLVAGGEGGQRGWINRRCGHQRLSHFVSISSTKPTPPGKPSAAVESSGAWPHFGQAWKWSWPGINTSLLGATNWLQPQVGQR